jgi:ADP-heptose:LPS heptosyltransferase
VLQKKVDVSEADLLANYPNIIDVHEHLSTFGDTAAVIHQLDLIISVDTSVAHLAGALNKPVWILLSDNANWRWFINRSDSPWYPSATLFRQNVFNQWNNVITDLKKSLKKFIKALAINNG